MRPSNVLQMPTERQKMNIQNVKVYERKGSIFWQISYDMIFENGDKKTVYVNTKIGLSEKTREYIKTKYAPALLAKSLRPLNFSCQ